MRKRNIHIQLWLNENEADLLNKRSKGCGYSREAYLRSLLDGHIPQAKPPPDYHAMMRELHAIGNNLNQVAQKAHVLNVVDVQRYDEALRLFAGAVARIEEAVILPMKTR
jgi:hypothetical protein